MINIIFVSLVIGINNVVLLGKKLIFRFFFFFILVLLIEIIGNWFNISRIFVMFYFLNCFLKILYG